MVVKIVTSNRERAALLSACVQELGFDAEHVLAELPEPQADSVIAVVRAKATAAAALGGPLLVEDSGLSIDALGGFPGPYLKYALATLGVVRLVEIAGGSACRFASAIALVEGDGAVDVLELALEGSVTPRLPAANHAPDVWQLFVPRGEDRPVAELPAAALSQHLSAWTGQVTDWLGALLARPGGSRPAHATPRRARRRPAAGRPRRG